VKNQDFIGKTNYFLKTLPFNPWAVSATWVHVGAPYKMHEKMSLILVFNKNSPQAHIESELGVLGIHGKLVKYVVHSSKGKKKKLKLFFFTQAGQTAIDQFLVSKNFRG
jgi:hypothetical protein